MTDERHPLCRCRDELLVPNRRDRRYMARNGRDGQYVTEHERGCPIAVSRRSTIRPAGQTRRAS